MRPFPRRTAEVSISDGRGLSVEEQKFLRGPDGAAMPMNLSYSSPEAKKAGLAFEGVRSRARTAVPNVARVNREAAFSHGAFLFDQAERMEARAVAPIPGLPGHQGFARRAGSALARYTGLAKLARWSGTGYANIDEFGGPRHEKLTWGETLRYGFGGGLAIAGINSAISAVQAVVDHVYPWQYWLSDGMLANLGRLDLLINITRSEALSLLAAHPARFLGWELPSQVLTEEVMFRGISFASTFALFAALRPVFLLTARNLDRMPEFIGIRSLTTSVLRVIAESPYMIAAVLSSTSFAAAHVPVRGMQPFEMLIMTAAGAILAHMAYRTRSLWAPIFAHFTFELLGFLGIIGAGLFAAPQLSYWYAIVLSIASVLYLLRNRGSFMRTRK